MGWTKRMGRIGLVVVAAWGVAAQVEAACLQPPGDVTGDGKVVVSDVMCEILAALASALPTGGMPKCLAGGGESADVNCSGGVDVSDVVDVAHIVLGVHQPVEADLDGDWCLDRCENVVCGATGAPECAAAVPGAPFEVCIDGPGCTAVPMGSTCVPGGGACGGRGTCTRTVPGGAFSCACPAGYAGASCERCAEGYHAVNRHGWPGEEEEQSALAGEAAGGNAAVAAACEADVSCEGVDCGPFGACDASGGLPACACEVGYAGSGCAECAPGYEAVGDGTCALGETCRKVQCGGRGECVEEEHGLACQCDAGVAGGRCEECAEGYHETSDGCAPDEECGEGSCSGHGTCTAVGGEVECACESGYGGPDCGDTCMGEDCSGQGVCVMGEWGAECVCSVPGLTPESQCAVCAPGLTLVVDAAGGASCVVEGPCGMGACNGHGECMEDATSGEVSCACEDEWVGPSCFVCPAGNFVVEGRCVAASVCSLVACGGRGVCEGQAVEPECACAAGFRGDACGEEIPVAAYEVDGAQDVVEWGGSAELSAEALGVGDVGPLVWTLKGPGTLIPTGPGTATYVAPSVGTGELEVVTLTVGPACCPNQAGELGLSLKAPAMPWVTGVAKDALKSVDQRVMQFMYDRCTGGATVGLQWMGVPIYSRGYGRTRGRSTPGRPAVDCGPVDPAGMPVHWDSPMRVGSVTKAVTATMLRRLVEFRLLQAGRLPSLQNYAGFSAWYDAVDRAVESVRILDVQLNLVPPAVRSVLGSCTWLGPLPGDYVCTDGLVSAPVAVPITDNQSPASCQGSPCFNEGQCVTLGPNSAACTCQAGFTGATCRILSSGNNVAANGVDRRYQTVTLRHLLTHTSGLPRSVVGQDFLLNNFAAIRGFHAPNEVLPEALGPTLGEMGVNGWVDPEGFPPARFVERRPSTYEYILAQLGRNLDYSPVPTAPGATPTRVYSNLGFVLLMFMLEYTSGAPDWQWGNLWGGDTLHHSDHLNSRLDVFVRSALGGAPGDMNPWGARRSRYGMFLARSPDPTAEPYWQLDPAELEPRDWASGMYNPPAVDVKGLVCMPDANGVACDFQKGIIDFFGNVAQAKYGYQTDLMEAGAGAMLSESHLYLRFMRKYHVGSTSTQPRYGRRRTSWDTGSSHSGGWLGTKAYVWQTAWSEDTLPGGGGPACTKKNATCDAAQGDVCCDSGFECVAYGRPSFPLNPGDSSPNRCVRETTYRIPLTDETTGDYSVDASADGTRSCVLPRGLDFFVATNQATDANDVGGRDYDYLLDAVLRGLCEVKWPANPYALSANSKAILVKPAP